MSKVCGGGSRAGSGCDREAGREASVRVVPKDCVSAMLAVVGLAMVMVLLLSRRPIRSKTESASRRNWNAPGYPAGLARGYRETSLTIESLAVG
jgi:hypothetical protein